MPININNDYVEFRVTDTLHQLVDRLNDLTGLLDSNIRLLDSGINNVLLVVDSNGDGLNVDSDLVINSVAGAITIGADSDVTITSGANLTLNSGKTTAINSADRIFLNADSGDILFRRQGTVFGGVRRAPDSNEMHFYTGADLVLAFDANLKSTFSGEIEMPASGTGAPTLVDARTVNEALDEIVSEHDSDHTALEARVTTNEGLITGLRTDVDNNSTLISNLDSDLNTQQALNTSARLALIESQIIQINNRLDILEIFT